MIGEFIKYQGNHYIVTDDQLKDGDEYITIDGVNRKVVWYYEAFGTHVSVYYEMVYMPFATGYTMTIAQDLVPIQPMDGPRGELFYLDF
jgi:hypothetical protein